MAQISSKSYPAGGKKLVASQELTILDDMLAIKTAKLYLFEGKDFQIYFNSIYSFLGSQNFENIRAQQKENWAREAAQIWTAIEKPYETQNIPDVIAAQSNFLTNGHLLRFEMKVEEYIEQTKKGVPLENLDLCLRLKTAVEGLGKNYQVNVTLKVDNGELIQVKMPVSALTEIPPLCDDCDVVYRSNIHCEANDEVTLMQMTRMQGLFRATISKERIQQVVYRRQVLYSLLTP